MRKKQIQSKTVAALCVLAALAVAPGPAAQSAQVGHCVCNLNVGAGDVLILFGNLTLNCVRIESGGKLLIEEGITLTLAGPEDSTVDGDIVLTGSASKLRFACSDHKVTGSGKIKGQNDAANIEVTSGVTLTNDVKIVGALKISGAGNFVNDGQVTADRHSGTLDILVTGTTDDTASASWAVKSSSTATLRFNVSVCLNGRFTVSSGALRAGKDSPSDDIDVVTQGDLTHTGGAIVAGNNDSFTFNGTCP